ncbi:MAG: hypothetical protein KC561_03470, partial [Myxococcales bacterium]|nr:hypothetical protein [Myxococcales bacterium]
MRQLGIVLVVALLAGTLLTGCPEAPVGTVGQELMHGQVGVTVTGTELAYLELQSESGAVQTTTEPVLIVRMTVTNHGETALMYDLREEAVSGNQANWALLFVDPGADQPVTQSHNIAPLALTEFRYPGDEVRGQRSLPSGESLNDVLLFGMPPEGTTSLKLSLPPTIFGADVKTNAWITIPYQASEPSRPAEAGLRDEVQGDGFSITIDSANVEYVPNADRSGFTEEPVLAVRYTVRNTGTQPLSYRSPARN